ncbi:prenyltransferase [Solemya velum gill symbiont]|uniref:prenyltransferase n=1 Tax=Solemya velum gill symbiont TaxID=2340 RepID=UPI000997671A|nr:prenyltransferase [Solemya velum gill symbiont]OOZ44333.1 hypothetical protein BOW37_06910 [Solemya velum gill symbiont]OOZ46583.1 hypothetical protein BOW38_06905 [Solemya velum gill symbiont]OOZ48904.1 hypothetical protein BOW39_08315 [Solemya velum gill symbiont]OOZ51391.1 hypothetical protein BOW40_07685 [Solemya velum gill symbiont]OOZ53966.1 hypothetical protein BOW41_07695 [Solemya velum gill symbiont]
MNTEALLLTTRSARPPFLILTLSCISLGVAIALSTPGVDVHLVDVFLILLAGIASHISVNAFNEYFDFRSGLDELTERTPFSGGSGLLPTHPDLDNNALLMAIVSLAACIGIGLYFTAIHGMVPLVIGAVGVLLIITYTHLITRSPFSSLLAPGIAFGPLMIIGSVYVLSGSISTTAIIASLIPFFLVNNLLLLNQYPDVEADIQVGRKNYPIMIGRSKSSLIYAAFTLLAFAIIPLGIATGHFPLLSLLALIPLVPALISVRDSFRHADDIPQLAQAMGLNVVVNLVTPALLAAALVI